MKKYSIREELLPFLPRTVNTLLYDPGSGKIESPLSGMQFHRAVLHAMCEKQRLESPDPRIPVAAFDMVKKDGTLNRLLRETGSAGFLLLHKDAARTSRSLVLVHGDDGAVLEAVSGGGAARAARVTDPTAVRAAAWEEFMAGKGEAERVMTGPEDRYCFTVRFSGTVAVGLQKPDVSAWRRYNAVCVILRNDGDSVVCDGAFAFHADQP